MFILDAIAEYTPADEREARGIIERVMPRLAHANSAVVLSAVKVIIRTLGFIAPDSDIAVTTTKKLAPPLVTLLSAEPEIQYVALRNINLISQKNKDILKQEIKVSLSMKALIVDNANRIVVMLAILLTGFLREVQ